MQNAPLPTTLDIEDTEYVECYSCIWAQNVDTEEIYIDMGNCNSESPVWFLIIMI